MGLSKRETQRRLKMFRANFRFLISDGSYPPHRQQRLYLNCQKFGLDWEVARRYVAPDAIQFLQQTIERIIDNNQITPESVAGLRNFQRRLGLTDEEASMLERFYDRVEQKIESHILKHAAYLSSPPLIAKLKHEIDSYALPQLRASYLHHFVDRQHSLARAMAGHLPNIQPSVSLYRDEVCHFEGFGVFLRVHEKVADAGSGTLVMTNLRLMVLQVLAVTWHDLTMCTFIDERKLFIATAKHQQGYLYCADAEYIAALIKAAKRAYTPQAAPQPVRGGKRLTPTMEPDRHH